MQFRQTTAEVNLSAIKHNIKEHQKLIGLNNSLMAVVKANGYGHGAIPVLNVAIEQGVKWAGVSSAEEAIQLRQAGVGIPILLMGGWYPEAIPTFFNYNITPSLYCYELAKILNEKAASLNTRLPVHIKVETGMGRLGFSMDQLNAFFNALPNFSNLYIEGIFSHLSSADESNQEFTTEQIRRFRAAVELATSFMQLRWVHVANSAGTFGLKGSVGNLHRLGISMYGQPSSSSVSENLNLIEAITWRSSICQLQHYPPNYPIGYGRTFLTTKESCIATVCAGYADGYFRALSNKGSVLVRGKKAPVVGRICMDMFMIDVSALHDVQLHDEVILIGKQGCEYISASDVAQWANTINYEVVCNISNRVPRIYLP